MINRLNKTITQTIRAANNYYIPCLSSLHSLKDVIVIAQKMISKINF